jgi:DNA polymerase II large subunit
MSEAYFSSLRDGLNRAYAVASEARKKGLDPSDEVEVKIAKDVAARVEGIVGPPGVAKIIRDLIEKGMSREDAAFEIARKIAGGEIIEADKERLIEQAVRTGVGILTEGVLVAPTEGISKVKIKQNPDRSDYVAVYYSGPIRSAGGTAAALSLVLADIARQVAGVGDYRATDTQIERYVEEVNTYEARVTHLQYKPPDDDIRHIVKNCPVSVDGEPTEDIEVSAYRGVPGVETNRVRGGVPLVICEGVAQKAAKLSKYTRKLNLGWSWLEKVIKIKRKADKIEIKPDETYLDGLVAGRPVFSHPCAKGGFRLRYGRSKTNSLMGKNIHPATMMLLDEFIAYGTHIKIERPGKGAVVAGFDGIEPPAVLLEDGSLTKVKSIQEFHEIKSRVKSILFLGDLMITYGDFLKSNHPLIPSGWCIEWWEKELQAKGLKSPEQIDAEVAFSFSKTHGVPLHPDYTFHWHDISCEQLVQLANWLGDAKLHWREDKISEMILPNNESKVILEDLLVEHRIVEGNVILSGDDAYSLLNSIGALEDKEINTSKAAGADTSKPALETVNKLSGILIKPKAPTYIGARMGRPEKAKERAMDGKPNVLFPTGSQKNRSLTKAYRTLKAKEGNKTVNLELVRYKCAQCKNVSFSRLCERCGSKAEPERICQDCGRAVDSEIHCDRSTKVYDRRPVDLVELMESSKTKLAANPAEVKGVKGLSNPMRVPERIEKGFLRAKHGAFVFRDGTSRFDATDISLTAFTPKEIGLSLDKLKELGYEKDISGNPATSDEQTFYLKHQDIVLAESGVTYFTKVTGFLDEMLVNLYGLRPFYNIKSKEDLIGHLGAGLSPHTSAGVLCRIIGFTKANVGYGHPYFHTAKRRNCDGDEDSIMLLLDALLNFSRHYLNETRGGTMDAPLVLTPAIDPQEVDDEAHTIEIVSSYPLEFYHAAEKITPPYEVKLKTVKDVLGTPEQYSGLPITHLGGTLDEGPTRTKYVQLGSIPEKITTQFDLQLRIRAVDAQNAAERLILSHFIPDLYGNLRSFSRQTFRCSSCNEIHRRPPLIGKCIRCGGNLLLTINKGGIKKYLEISRKICDDYDLPIYLKQRLELVEREIKSIFEDDKIKQTGLADFL